MDRVGLQQPRTGHYNLRPSPLLEHSPEPEAPGPQEYPRDCTRRSRGTEALRLRAGQGSSRGLFLPLEYNPEPGRQLLLQAPLVTVRGVEESMGPLVQDIGNLPPHPPPPERAPRNQAVPQDREEHQPRLSDRRVYSPELAGPLGPRECRQGCSRHNLGTAVLRHPGTTGSSRGRSLPQGYTLEGRRW